VTAALDWLTPLREQGPVRGLTRPLQVSWSVPKAPGGEGAVTVRFEPAPGSTGSAGGDARGGGDATGAGDGVDEVELSATAAVAGRLVAGELTPNVAWMSGQLKAAGPTGPLLALLAHAQPRS
jgi:hypothetical protein